MSLRFKSVALAAFMLGLTANAQENNAALTETFFQPQADQLVIEGAFSFSSAEVETDSTETETETNRLAFGFAYGLNENVSLGLRLPWLDGESTQKRKVFPVSTESNSYDGLSDLVLNTNVILPMSTWNLTYGANLGLSLQNAKFDSNGDRTNAFSGQHVLDLYIGFETSLDNDKFVGARLSREFNLGDGEGEVEGSSNVNFDGGETLMLSGFYENRLESGRWGASLTYSNTADGEDEDGDTVEYLSTLLATVYGVIPLGEGAIELLPSFTYGKGLDDDLGGSEIDSTSLMAIYLGARFHL